MISNVYATHVKLYHSGVRSTVTALLQSYWIPTARQYVKSLFRCVVCRKHSGKPYIVPDPVPQPKMRMQDIHPFSVTGFDFTGALYVHCGGEEIKVYVCLFTCATSRAIHLEMVADLSTETFLLAFWRFVGCRSTPQLIISDNATTFQSAAEELKTLSLSKEARAVLNREGVTWRFIPKKWGLLGVPSRPYKICNQEGTVQLDLNFKRTCVCITRSTTRA